jgi:tetratricopeptide (TPR) repeat protein/predicted Ser/Thr protein kinase
VSLAADDLALFGFESEAWLDRLQEAETSAVLGRLGAYELLEEAGRGGQGVVFRARQPGTGREIALKRLLAGTFASASARRRFEREVEAVTALNHPGIVTIYGVEEVEGAPLLAMEWIEGEPVTAWAAGRPRAEILALFLQVCDAVQHAHQRGVLHRDLKPSNVVVDPGGRPRVLDFGLAKVASERGGTVSVSGGFVGTPAYAAPEQWRGGEIDVRADVYSLGAILFEMLTGRRVLEGEGLEVLARAERSDPPRPSSLVRSLSRELDAIVLQALSREPEARYQSVDALSGDVRRYLAGEAVLAHPPGAWYQLRKLVARNRLASGLVVVLLLATLVYALSSARQARHLSEQRNRALAASAAESLARAAAEQEKRGADEARGRAEEEQRKTLAALAETERERANAQAESEKAQAVLKFLLEDVIAAADPSVLGHEPTLAEILRAAASKVTERFGQSPAAELEVRAMLAYAFFALGHYSDAEAPARRSLELQRADADSTPLALAGREQLLGRILLRNGALAEAQALLEAAVANWEAAVPLDAGELGRSLESLAGLYLRAGKKAEAIAILERLALDDAFDQEQLADVRAFALGAKLFHELRYEEARPALEEAVKVTTALRGQRSEHVAGQLDLLALVYQKLGDSERAGEAYRRALEIRVEMFGEGHPRTAANMGHLAQFLTDHGDIDEAVELARRSLDVVRATAPGSPVVVDHAAWLANALLQKNDYAQAEPAFAELLALRTNLNGLDDPYRLDCADLLGMVLTENGKLDEAEGLLVDVAERRRRSSGSARQGLGITLCNLGNICRVRGALADAGALYEEAILLLEANPAQRDSLVVVLGNLAETLRAQGDPERAAELEHRAAALGR